ncbi:MAG: glycoside hydrolase family 13 protein [Treponema sp.]|nr:glycoside hydrolase family 13 protein [Treponema sp.]
MKTNINLAAVVHRSAFADCCPINSDEVKVCLHTGKEVTKVNLIYNDPFIEHVAPGKEWYGITQACAAEYELAYNFIWTCTVKPQYKRFQYYFEIISSTEKVYFFEDGFYSSSELAVMKNFSFFDMPWINPSDVISGPSWVQKTVWYEIYPDRFCSAGNQYKRLKNRSWGDETNMSWTDFYGGDIRGIISRLDYLQELGITGIYLTPVFESPSNHKYDTTDYTKIDPDFGTEDDMVELSSELHQRGMRIMIDAVFNHCGASFKPWLDVTEKGSDSEFLDWFFVNKFPVLTDDKKTDDGRYYSFSFEAGMPKLNTGNPQTAEYLISICRHWVSDWHIDGIRMDVGDEISHSFIKLLRKELKALNPDLFLLGEIWHDSIQWLQGDEYDSVMNYPLLAAVDNFWDRGTGTAEDLRQALNGITAMYSVQTERMLFNFLDTHDTIRAFSKCRTPGMFFQKFVLMLTLQGSFCLYYGTEAGLKGASPYNRGCMPWNLIDSGSCGDIRRETAELIKLRKSYPQFYSPHIEWFPAGSDTNSRLIHYGKYSDDTMNPSRIEVYMQTGTGGIRIGLCGNETILYRRKFSDGMLDSEGILIVLKKDS